MDSWFHLSVDSKVKNSLMSERQIFFIGNVIWQREMRGFPGDQYDATIMFSYVFLYTCLDLRPCMEESDLMSHTWILECLVLYKIKSTIRSFIKDWKGMWKTTPEANSKPTAQVITQRSTYEGDTLSRAINTYAFQSSDICIITWLKERTETTHIRTRKLLTIQKGFHP